MWFIITFFAIAGILQLAAIVGFFISLIETIFKIEIVKENSWMDRVLARYFFKPLAITFLVMFCLLIIYAGMKYVLGDNC
jgi:hypothetical protein